MDVKKPKFEFKCIGRQANWPNCMALFSIRNVSEIAASNMKCLSLNLLQHDNKKYIYVEEDQFPSSIMPYHEHKFSVDSILFNNRELGDRCFELHFIAEDEMSNSFFYIAKKLVDVASQDSKKYIEGPWDVEVIKTKLNDGSMIDYSLVSALSSSIKKSLEDVNILVQAGRYSSAVDRIHTAFHGYLKQLLDSYSCSYDKINDSIPACFSKLRTVYEKNIKPQDMKDNINKILRSAGAMIDNINQVRNNNSLAHPNENLIAEREAKLVVNLVNVLFAYIIEIEKEFHS